MTSGYAPGRRFDADENRWLEAKAIIGNERVTLGPTASQQWLHAPEHLAMVLARYRAAAALIGGAQKVLEAGAGECLGAGILAKGRRQYVGIDTDEEALTIAAAMYQGRPEMTLHAVSATTAHWIQTFDAVVALDVAEHIPPEHEAAFFENLCRALTPHGVMVVGTPSEHMRHLASEQSRAGHVNLFTPERLQKRLGRHFHAVQMLFMQDVAVHWGHPEAAHYILAVGVSPRERDA